MIRLFFATWLAAWVGFALTPVPGAYAVEPAEILKDPVLEKRARKLSAELRCLVCQNQSIDDSDAPLAKDLRVLVRERLKAGDSNAQVMDYVVARYGEFVLLKPRFNAHTFVLWLSPLLILLLSGIYLYRRATTRQGSAPAKANSLSDDEQRRLKSLLDGD